MKIEFITCLGEAGQIKKFAASYRSFSKQPQLQLEDSWSTAVLQYNWGDFFEVIFDVSQHAPWSCSNWRWRRVNMCLVITWGRRLKRSEMADSGRYNHGWNVDDVVCGHMRNGSLLLPRAELQDVKSRRNWPRKMSRICQRRRWPRDRPELSTE